MTEELERFLAGRYVAVVGTVEPDGSVHLAAVWYAYEDGVLLVPTSRLTRKARNAAARGHATLLVDARGAGPLRGVSASGPATLLTGAEAAAVNARIRARYLSAEGLAEPAVGGAIAAHDDVTIRIEPSMVRSWSTDDDFGGAMEQPGITLPLDG